MPYSQLIHSAPAVLVEFYASWCPHCHRMMPIVAEIRELLAGSLKVEQFDIDENSDLAAQEGADSVPTFILYRDGEEVWRQTGEMSAETLLSHIQANLN